MLTFILTLIIVALVISGMAVGSIFQNKPIKGSCGGIAALGIDTECEICGGDPNKCEEVPEQTVEDLALAKLAVDATQVKKRSDGARA